MTVDVVNITTTTVDAVDLGGVPIDAGTPIVVGPPGPPGPPSSGWLFEQPTPLGSWTIAHPFGRPVAVTCIVDGQPTDTVCTVTATHVYLTWPYPVAGTAILS